MLLLKIISKILNIEETGGRMAYWTGRMAYWTGRRSCEPDGLQTNRMEEAFCCTGTPERAWTTNDCRRKATVWEKLRVSRIGENIRWERWRLVLSFHT